MPIIDSQTKPHWADIFKEHWSAFVNLLFPNLCSACGNHLGRAENVICTICEYQLPKTNFHVQADNEMERRFWGRVPIVHATALYYFEKGASVQNLIHELKYNGKQEVGIRLGQILGQDIKNSPHFKQIDLIVPVPLHKKRLSKRGYNQCDLFAEGISMATNIPFAPDVLSRVMYNESQTGKNRIDRFGNVQNIFECRAPHNIANKHILLVDDVVTTGATLEACSMELLKASNVAVSIATIAIAQ
ncbi:MAG: ComF family protein [Chitinophagales bacterium]|nr:ComF family protein [Chitinophagales bacterium]